jgi:hypothetical protein
LAALTTLTIVKRFPYRGNASEEFSNTYSFKAAPPTDSASWLAVADSLRGFEQPIFWPGVSFVRAYGYNSDNPSDPSVWTHDWTQPGPPPVGTGTFAGHGFAGDQAACVEWMTDSRNSRGKMIYLRKYLHSGAVGTVDVDQLDNSYLTALENYAGTIGPFHGGLTSRHGNRTITGHYVIPWVTTRTLKRRGKRPPLGG